MDDDRVEPADFQHDDIAGELLGELRLGHRMATVLHHHDLVVVALQKRQGLGKDFGRLVNGKIRHVISRRT